MNMIIALASQSDTLGYEKKVISESNTTGADEGFTKSYQDAFEAPLGTFMHRKSPLYVAN